MLRMPQKSYRHAPPHEAASFIAEDGCVLLMVEPLGQSAGAFFSLDGRIVTLYDSRRRQLPSRFALGPQALAALRYYNRLTIAEIDAEGPVRTTTNLAVFAAHEAVRDSA